VFFLFRYALKVIQYFGAKEKMAVDNEVELLQKIDHPNIVKYFGTFMHTSEMQCILVEYCEVYKI
jgi:serine/threonine protein kinase